MTCRVCGCHDMEACVRETALTVIVCFWVSGDLCSFCALGEPVEGRARRPVPGVDILEPQGGLL